MRCAHMPLYHYYLVYMMGQRKEPSRAVAAQLVSPKKNPGRSGGPACGGRIATGHDGILFQGIAHFASPRVAVRSWRELPAAGLWCGSVPEANGIERPFNLF